MAFPWQIEDIEAVRRVDRGEVILTHVEPDNASSATVLLKVRSQEVERQSWRALILQPVQDM